MNQNIARIAVIVSVQSKVLRVESREVYRELASIALMAPVLAPASEVAVGSLDLASELLLVGHEDAGVVTIGMIDTLQVFEHVVPQQNLGLDSRN